MKEFKMTIDDWSVLMNQQDRIERMLKWIIAKHTKPPSPYPDDSHEVLPDISDILEEKC